MPEGRKIATCCYCGTRSVLVLDRSLHELACGACGAPLHDMKALPQATVDKARKKRGKRSGPLPTYPVERDSHAGRAVEHPASYRRSKPKKRKSLFRRALSEVWDEIEDIFD